MTAWIKAVALVAALACSGWAQGADTVNLNRADAAVLMTHLVGIGEVKARAIIAYRQANGPFQSIDELVNVKGIGEKLLARNRDRLSLDQGLSALEESRRRPGVSPTA